MCIMTCICPFFWLNSQSGQVDTFMQEKLKTGPQHIHPFMFKKHKVSKCQKHELDIKSTVIITLLMLTLPPLEKG